MVTKKGGKIAEKDLVTVIELLMNELIKLDAIVAEGDVKLQRKMQVCNQKHFRTNDFRFSQCSLVVTFGFYVCLGEESAELCGDTRCLEGEKLHG